jgi:hypothetical protein
VDGDGDLDQVMSVYDVYYYYPDYHMDEVVPWLNDGAGLLTSGAPFDVGRNCVEVLQAVDLDGDGIDEWLCDYELYAGGVWSYLPDLSGSYLPTDEADLDGDGDPDIVGWAADGVAWWSNDGAGGLSEPALLFAGNTNGVGVGDLDLDGDADLVLASDDGVAWLPQVSPGVFGAPQLVGTEPVDDVVVVDVEPDGLPAVCSAGRSRSAKRGPGATRGAWIRTATRSPTWTSAWPAGIRWRSTATAAGRPTRRKWRLARIRWTRATTFRGSTRMATACRTPGKPWSP